MRGWAYKMRGAAFVSILVVIWGAVSRGLATPLAPGPFAVGHAIADAVSDGTLVRAVLVSLARLLVGYAVALATGIPLGVSLARSRMVKGAVGPLVLGLSAVPSICWLPLAILWFGLSELAIQVVVVLGAVLPVAIATENAVRHVPPQIDRAARTMGARGARLLLTVTIPAALPGILSGAKLGWTFALRSLMAGELLFVSGGLGQLLETGRDLGDTALVLAIVLVIVGLGRASEWLLFGRVDREIGRRWGAEVA
jgi:NitT/TauT family transport system permease protein